MKDHAPLIITGVPISEEWPTKVSQSESPSQPASVDLWGEVWINEQPAVAGTLITILDRFGVELGRCVVREAGKYGFLHIAIDEALSDISVNDVIRFQIEGISVDYLLPNLSPMERDRIHLDIKVE